MVIKYLVLGGGGAGGYALYGALKYLSKNNYWSLENIESIYGTSIGALIGVFISLKYDWNSLDDYIIKRPWDKVIIIKPLDLINIWNEKGIFNHDIIKTVLKPLLSAKELSDTITLQEFYEYNNIEFHMYTTNINEDIPIKIDISYKTHPNLELYKAIAMSTSYPVFFSPICDNSGCYMDGGLLNNFPLDDCLKQTKDENEILAIKISSKNNISIIDDNSDLYNYIYVLLDGMRKLISTDNHQSQISNIVHCILENNFNSWKDAIINSEIRENMVELGIKFGKTFLTEREK